MNFYKQIYNHKMFLHFLFKLELEVDQPINGLIYINYCGHASYINPKIDNIL